MNRKQAWWRLGNSVIRTDIAMERLAEGCKGSAQSVKALGKAWAKLKEE